MINQKPFSPRLLKTLILIKLILPGLIILIYLLTKDVTVGEESIRAGMRAALNNRLGLNYGFSSYEFGYLMGSVMFPMLFVALVFLFVLKRKFVWVVVFAVLELIVGLAFSFPFLSIIILVVILTNPTRDYLKRKNKSSPPSAMPIDYDFKDN